MVARKLTRAQQAEVDAKIDAAVKAAVAQAVAAETVAHTSSKPHLVSDLRGTWRKSSQHLEEQAVRFVRLFIVSAIPAVVALTTSGGDFDKKTLLALLVPVAETAYRQVFPALGASKADDAPGVTIVPAQLDSPSVDPVTEEPVEDDGGEMR